MTNQGGFLLAKGCVLNENKETTLTYVSLVKLQDPQQVLL